MGLLVFVGIEDADTDEDIEWLSNKIVNLRIFNDENNVPNISVKDIDGDILAGKPVYFACANQKRKPPIIHKSKQG